MRNPLPTSTTELLDMIGLQRKPSVASYLLPSLGVLGIGMLAGAGLGLLLAPQRGDETRRMVGTKLSELGHTMGHTAGQVVRKLRHTRTAREAASAALADVRESEYVADAYDLHRREPGAKAPA